MPQFPWQLFYIFFQYFAIAAFMVNGACGIFFCVCYIFSFLLYQRGVFSALTRNDFSWIAITSVWFVGGVTKYSWLFFVNSSQTELPWPWLGVGLLLCALGVLLAELIFFLFMRAISGQRWWGKFPVFWKVTFYLFLLSLQQLFVTGQFFFFLGQNKGFSINNPLLPLMIPLLSLFPNVKIVDLQTAKLLFVPTLACMGDCFASYVESVESNDFFRILVTAGCRWGMCQQKVFLAPESFFDYYPKHLKKILWQDCLGFQDIVVAGATISADNAAQRHQVALVVQQKQVCCMHKQLLCPLYEEFYFTVVPQPEARLLRIGFASYQLMICAEFFLAPLNYSWPRSDGILLLVKEKMFPEFFYKMLLSSAIFFSLWRGKSIIWVDYNGLRIINFFGRVGNKELVYGQKGLRNVD